MKGLDISRCVIYSDADGTPHAAIVVGLTPLRVLTLDDGSRKRERDEGRCDLRIFPRVAPLVERRDNVPYSELASPGTWRSSWAKTADLDNPTPPPAPKIDAPAADAA